MLCKGALLLFRELADMYVVRLLPYLPTMPDHQALAHESLTGSLHPCNTILTEF